MADILSSVKMKTEETCADRLVLERGKEDINIRAGSESETEIPPEDEPELVEEHQEELPPPEAMEREETSPQRLESKQEAVQGKTPRPRRAIRRSKLHEDFFTDF